MNISTSNVDRNHNISFLDSIDIFDLHRNELFKYADYITFVSKMYENCHRNDHIIFFEKINDTWYGFQRENSIESPSCIGSYTINEVINHIFYDDDTNYGINFMEWYERTSSNINARYREMNLNETRSSEIKDNYIGHSFCKETSDRNHVDMILTRGIKKIANLRGYDFDSKHLLSQQSSNIFNDLKEAKDYLEYHNLNGWVYYKFYFEPCTEYNNNAMVINEYTGKLNKLERKSVAVFFSGKFKTCTCRECRKKLVIAELDDHFCPYCGNELRPTSTMNSLKKLQKRIDSSVSMNESIEQGINYKIFAVSRYVLSKPLNS